MEARKVCARKVWESERVGEAHDGHAETIALYIDGSFICYLEPGELSSVVDRLKLQATAAKLQFKEL
jgi:hypothetical protein